MLANSDDDDDDDHDNNNSNNNSNNNNNNIIQDYSKWYYSTIKVKCGGLEIVGCHSSVVRALLAKASGPGFDSQR